MASLSNIAQLGLIAYLVSKAAGLFEHFKKQAGKPLDPVQTAGGGREEFDTPSDTGLSGFVQRQIGISITPAVSAWIPINAATSATFVDTAWSRSFAGGIQKVAKEDVTGINGLFSNLSHNESLKNSETFIDRVAHPGDDAGSRWNAFMSQFGDGRRLLLGTLKGLVDAGSIQQ